MHILSAEDIIKFSSFRNKYDLLSNSVARKIFEAVKQEFPNRNSFGDSFYENQDGEDYIIDFFIKFVNRNDIKTDIKAGFYYPEENTDPYVDIKINIGLDFSQLDLERLYWKLYEVIRHEYEHFDKYLKGFYPDEQYSETIERLKQFNLNYVDKANLISQYMLDPIEIDSYARSIVYVAKKRKTPYAYVIDDILNRALFGSDEDVKRKMLENKEIGKIAENIKNGLAKRIRAIFPSIKLEDQF